MLKSKIYICILGILIGSSIYAESKVAIFKEKDFPFINADKSLSPELIKKTIETRCPGTTVDFLSADDIRPEKLRAYKLFVNPYGEAFPDSKIEILMDAHASGLSILNLSGTPYSAPVKFENGKWISGAKSDKFVSRFLRLPLTVEAGVENIPAKPDTCYLTEEGEKFWADAIQPSYMLQPTLDYQGKWRYKFRCTPEIARLNPYWTENGDYVFDLAAALSVSTMPPNLAKGAPIRKGGGVIAVMEYGKNCRPGTRFVLFGFKGQENPLMDNIETGQKSEESAEKLLSAGGAGQKNSFPEAEDTWLKRLLPSLIDLCVREVPVFSLSRSADKDVDVFYTGDEISYNIEVYNPFEKQLDLDIEAEYNGLEKRLQLHVSAKDKKNIEIKFNADKLGMNPINVRLKWKEGKATKTGMTKSYPVTVVRKLETDKSNFAGIIYLPHPIKEKMDGKEDFSRSLSLMKYAGISYLHTGFPRMNHIAKAPGVFEWGDPDFDFVYEQLARYGLYADGNVVGMAKWAAKLHSPKATEWFWAPPSDMKYWRDYVEAGMKRYGNKLDSVTVWGEMWGLSPEQYVEMFNIVTDVVKKTAPHIIVGGPVSGYVDLALINKVVEECPGLGAVDFHLYPGSQCWTWAGGWENLFKDIASVKEILKKHGKEGLPLWVTEAGKSNSAGFESEQAQAENLVKAISVMRHVGISRILWFSLRTTAGGREFEFSILRSSRMPRPAYAAYNNMIYMLKDSVNAERVPRLISDLPFSIEKPEEQIFLLLFENRKNACRYLIAWTSENRPRAGWKKGPVLKNTGIEIPYAMKNVYEVDIFGNRTPYPFKAKNGSGIITATLSDEPVIFMIE